MSRPSDSIVITGVAGNFPDSNGVVELRDNLFNKVDLVSDDDRRWSKFHAEIPQRSGKIDGVGDFDAGFFGLSRRSAAVMEPATRICLEKVYEAMVDSGHHPDDFRVGKTGVYIATCLLESESYKFRSKSVNTEALVCCTKMAFGNTISYYFNLNGASLGVDSACSTSLYALHAAYHDMKKGIYDKAIVCASNLCLQPYTTLQFSRLGVLSTEGCCKSFDDSGNGYVRSEGVVTIILERRLEANRVYAELIHCKTNCDGYKEQGITFPSSAGQQALLREVYTECKVDPKTMSYVEGHGTGTIVGDPQELETIDEIFCKGREKPLPIGSIKSNIGHNEPASGLSSIVKMIIGMEAGYIPPNIHYSSPRKGVDALEKGRVKVVTEKTPWLEEDVFVGVNSFGFGGANGHAVLHWNTKEKRLGRYRSNIPKLICMNGRTHEAVMKQFDDVSKKPMDEEFIKLIHQVYKRPILNNPYQGYMIWEEGKHEELERCVSKKPLNEGKLCVVFTEFDENANDLNKSLEIIPKYSSKRDDIHEIIKNMQIPANGIEKYIVQLILAELLKDLNVSGTVQAIAFGKHLEIIANLFNNTITLKEAALALCNTGDPKLKRSNLTQAKDATFLIVGSDSREIKGRKIQLINPSRSDYLKQLLRSLGKLCLQGFCMELDQLYPKVDLPVSRGTPMLSPMVKWDHTSSYHTYKFTYEEYRRSGQNTVYIEAKQAVWSYITGHIVDGRNLFPATGYLVLAWEAICNFDKQFFTKSTVVFEEVKFLRAANVPADGALALKVTVSQENDTFSISEQDVELVTGTVYSSDSGELETSHRAISDETVFMDQRDIYKELRLRGYNYRDEFKAIQRSGIQGKTATIAWNNNWTTFMDNMLQLSILQGDSRNLYVPTSINKIVINATKHRECAMSYNNQIPIYTYKETNTIRGGGIEITGLGASTIARRKQPEPILETYKFVPDGAKLTRHQAIRCLVQTVLENTNTIKVKAVEVLEDNDDNPIMLSIQQTLGDLPLIQPELKVLTKREDLYFPEIVIEDKKLGEESTCLILVVRDGYNNPELLSTGLRITRDSSGFIITTQGKGSPSQMPPHVQVLSWYETDEGNVLLLKESQQYIEKIPVNITSIDELSWLERLQNLISKNIVLYSQNVPFNGLLGLVNCLRREWSGNNISAMLISDDLAPPFNIEDNFYKSQLRKGLAVNVFRNGSWGNYRHLLLPDADLVTAEHCYVNVTTTGDLSSLRWIEGPLSIGDAPDSKSELVRVHYSAINFRDIMMASGRLSSDVITQDRVLQECIQGLEFSGISTRDSSRRVMGMVVSGALATLIAADPKFLWPVPDSWSLEDATTVPVVYSTVLYAFITRGRMKSGQSVLIHSGTGGVGQAAINVATYLGCTIFVTVGTREKREFIRKHFPQIKEEHIGDSRSTSFEQMILERTGRRGVDFVLNSLAEEKLRASVRCLARNGTFLEIGKFDLANDNQLAAMLVKKQARFEGVMLDRLFSGMDECNEVLSRLLKEGISNGSVKPLVRTVFPGDKPEEAYRFMATGKHIGKVLLKVRDEKPRGQPEFFKGIPRLSCNPSACYVILGGLGGFGLELADWLVIRGAKQLILTSRKGVQTGYQSRRLSIFKTYGVKAYVRDDDIGTETGCSSLLNFAESIGPVEAIFNLAVVLKDALFENQTVDTFKTSLMPKAYATRHLDVVSRRVCPKLRYFVVFSSVSCGRGNAGQTNYGMANSVMERLCEKRKADGYPALAIQWGAVGDVGLVAEMQEDHKELVIGGTLAQRISNCLHVLDRLLKQHEPVVSSMVVAEKAKTSGGNNIVDVILGIIGVKIKTVSLHTTLAEMGMDSMMGVEIKQTLEREFDVFMSAQDLRNMTLAKLQSLQDSIKESGVESNDTDIPQDIKMILHQLGDKMVFSGPIVPLKTTDIANSSKLFALPGIEGMASTISGLSQKLSFDVTCFQYCPENHANTIELLANDFVRVIESVPGDFNILAYSFGCLLAAELMYVLESRGKVGKAFFIDGSPELMHQFVKTHLPHKDEETLETSVLCAFMSKFRPWKVVLKHKDAIHQQQSYESKIRYIAKVIPDTGHSDDQMVELWKAGLARIQAIRDYEIKDGKLNSKVMLAKPSKVSVMDIEDDYQLSRLCSEPVLVKVFEGDHNTMLENDDLAKEINIFFEKR